MTRATAIPTPDADARARDAIDLKICALMDVAPHGQGLGPKAAAEALAAEFPEEDLPPHVIYARWRRIAAALEAQPSAGGAD